MNKREVLIGKLYIGYIFVLLVSIFTKATFNYATSFALYVLLVSTLIGFALKRTIGVKDGLFIVVFVIYVISITVANPNAGIGSAITLIVAILALITMRYILFTRLEIEIFRRVCCLFVLIMVTVSFRLRTTSNYVSFYNSVMNPNTWSEILLLVSMLYCSLNIRGRYNKWINLIIMVLTIFAMVNCRTRGMSVVAIAYTVFMLLPIRLKSSRVMKSIVIIIIVLGTIFPLIYLRIYESGFFAMINGKSIFTGREYIWQKTINELGISISNFVFGIGSQALDGINYHNLFLSVLANYGIIGYLLFFGCFIVLLFRIIDTINYEYQTNALYAFVFGMLMLGFSETTLLWAPMIALGYIGIAISREENKKAIL